MAPPRPRFNKKKEKPSTVPKIQRCALFSRERKQRTVATLNAPPNDLQRLLLPPPPPSLPLVPLLHCISSALHIPLVAIINPLSSFWENNNGGLHPSLWQTKWRARDTASSSQPADFSKPNYTIVSWLPPMHASLVVSSKLWIIHSLLPKIHS